ncbi:hypothetical protein ACFE04_005055 [Oxalis oulophora]
MQHFPLRRSPPSPKSQIFSIVYMSAYRSPEQKVLAKPFSVMCLAYSPCSGCPSTISCSSSPPRPKSQISSIVYLSAYRSPEQKVLAKPSQLFAFLIRLARAARDNPISCQNKSC